MSLQHLASLIADRAGEGRAAVALSGGVDSGLAAAAAFMALGDRAVACTVSSELTPKRDRLRAAEAAERIGIEHHVLDMSALASSEVRRNLSDRCYHCKRLVFGAMRDAVGGESLLIDGTNAEDDPARPGLRAVREFGVYSVLADAGLGKSEIRSLAREAGLPNWDAPSESCLATRISEGVELAAGDLGRVADLETFLHSLGADTVRVRPDNLMATVEHLPQFGGIMMKNRDKIVAVAEAIGFGSCRFREWS
ncbi:ATP-dependent sacrificial sulfur transferase LarE [Pseudodesulfovibrio thermohalotolerans]|uniref:ATP-dependent sacrificial sulfur transferase LarE n=1 Tax=Pseudodesulfovibrio thermohalotolerans TaxID=2880651 RepID=UPI0024412EEA|nr:ATP-dependent sacrificial sulfur transferase LarE [Pseudodesulfovibrio thermohalotolerans]WFS62264.1 ATP-dependent sacrificial sulfur transferase LarE [Pseudodesulfovibrio thermohalotolerans]